MAKAKGEGETVIVGGDEVACVGHYGTAMAGIAGIAYAGHHGTAVTGDLGTASAGYEGTAITGFEGYSFAGDYGKARAGAYGVIAIRWFDSEYHRNCLAVGYVGRDGIKPNTLYQVVDGKLEEVKK